MLEKEETLKKETGLVSLLLNIKAKYIVGTILLSVIGIALPRVFHIIAGSSAGAIYLPMHISVLITALTFGAISSTIVAGSSIVCSYLLTGMPTLSRLPYMLIELVIYAILLSVLNRKFNSYVSLIATIIIGRVFYAGILFVAVNCMGLHAYGITVMESVRTGLPGIIIQLICVPFIAKFMNERLNLKND